MAVDGRRGASRLLKLAVLAVSVYYAGWGGEYGLREIRGLRREQATIADETARIRAESDSIRRTADRLARDPLALERVARERFGMIRPGERLVRFVETDPGLVAARPSP